MNVPCEILEGRGVRVSVWSSFSPSFLLSFPLAGPSAPSFVAGAAGSACAQDGLHPGPEDEISIIVWDHPDLVRKIRINLEGRISFPS